MTLLAALLLGALALRQSFDWLVSWLNLGALDPQVPERLRAVTDADAYRRSQDYTRERTLFGYVAGAAELIALVAFWFAGGFGRLDAWLRTTEWSELAIGLAFLGVLLLARTLFELPFAAYSTFVLEKRFGFNRTSPRTFALDVGKSLLLTAVLFGPLVAFLLALFQALGPAGWMIAWPAAAGLLVIIDLIYPVWILPLFHRLTPLPDGALRSAIERAASDLGFALDGLAVIDASRRSTRSNAFVIGLGRRRRIVLSDTLIQRHDLPELVAIVAHEIGHARRRHLPKLLALSIAKAGLVVGAFALALDALALHGALFVAQPSVHVALLAFALLLGPFEVLLDLPSLALSRRFEFEADRFAAERLDSGRELQAALSRLSAQNLTNLTPHPLFVTTRSSHPPVLARLAALDRWPGMAAPETVSVENTARRRSRQTTEFRA
ncbi:MAG: M48 family metallopeptidase [Acidobacteriota bacterium]